MVAVYSNCKKNQQQLEENFSILLVWCYPSVWKMRQFNLTQNGNVNTMFCSQNYQLKPPRILTSMLSSSSTQANLLDSQSSHEVAPVYKVAVDI